MSYWERLCSRGGGEGRMYKHARGFYGAKPSKWLEVNGALVRLKRRCNPS